MNLIHRLRSAVTSHGEVTFCDACGEVCDAACRAAARRRHIHERQWQRTGLPRF